MVRPGMTTTPLVIAGPTASGKSALALALAERVGGEIVCADSRQIYAGMPIATAAPSADERARVPHHLYGAVPPEDTMTAAAFSDRADTLAAEIAARGRVPVLVGGTGLYLRAWRLGLDPPGAPRDMDAMLRRAPRVHARWFLVDAPLPFLEPRIATRARAMFDAGLAGEARALRERLGPAHRLLDTLGVAEALALVDGRCTLDEAVARTAVRTRQYARRQRTWFKKEPWWTRLDAAALDVEALRT